MSQHGNVFDAFQLTGVPQELVAMSLPLDFTKNVDSIVVPESSRHFVVIHGQVVLLNSPKTGETRRVNNLENTRLHVLPSYKTTVALGRIIQ